MSCYLTCMCVGCKTYRKEKGLPEPVDPYEAKVRRIAEILVRPTISDGSYAMRESNVNAKAYWNNQVRVYTERARAMVAEMAAQYEAGYEQAGKDYGYAIAHSDPDIKAYQIERGLIPSPTKTGEK